jgi:uncharacterized protein YlzI (FlbEa/FlbD family)
MFYEITSKKECKKYTRFTPDQKLYLSHIFKINKLPDYNILLSNMSKFNVKNQIITKKRLKVYFKNKRYRYRKTIVY